MKCYNYPPSSIWKEICRRPAIKKEMLDLAVREIFLDVKQNGDDALKQYAARFDNWQAGNLQVTQKEIDEAEQQISGELKAAILLAKENIEKFHTSQVSAEPKIETSTGIFCWRKSVAIEKVGLYIPGGSAPLFSTLLMLAIPAKIAGCEEIIVCTPAQGGNIHPAILYVAKVLELKKVFKSGGAQAIAAMAFGTETIPEVYKIFGPGNQYVTYAKQLANIEGISIDMPAGPSELAVFADKTSIPKFVASDLLSQAEHGADSQVLLISDSPKIIDEVKKEIDHQRHFLSRKKEIDQSLNNSVFVILEAANAFNFLNEYAPEHLIIASGDPVQYVDKIKNAGSVFLGNYSPESAGDYISGTNHTLPTGGFAKTFSGVSIDSFIKKITFQQISKEGLKNVKSAIEIMAETEGLDAHKNAVVTRFEKN